jgi:hypothetical protein
VVESKNRDGRQLVLTKGVLNLIDLAGSEGAGAHAQGSSSQRTQEMKFINRVRIILELIDIRNCYYET